MFVAEYTGVPDDAAHLGDGDGDDGLDGPAKIAATGVSVGLPYEYRPITVTFNSGSRRQVGVNIDITESAHILVGYVSLVANPVPVPDGPTLLLTPGSGQVRLDWTDSPGATSYNIYRGGNPGDDGWHNEDFGHPLRRGVTQRFFIDDTVVNNQTYAYIVEAVNDAGIGQVSHEELARLDSAASPPAPTDVRADASSGRVSLSWSRAPFANSYRIFRTTDPSLPGPPAIGQNTLNYYDLLAVFASTGDTFFDDNAVTGGITYYYVVAAKNLDANDNPVPGGLPFDADVPHISTVVSATPP
jgi:fibronectin type 3 domain-containing protein